MKSDSHTLVAIDAAVVAAVSIAICIASHNLVFMTVFVPAVILLRMLLLWSISKKQNVNIKAEMVFLAICTLLGGFNDWNTVVNKGVYVYTVPHFFTFSSIPLWMLLFWGMILRFFARFARWSALGPPDKASNIVHIGNSQIDSAAVKVIVELLIVLLTRMAIYKLYMHPVFSWLPFLAGLALALYLFKPLAHDYKLLIAFLVIGPFIEALYIQVGDLHYYHLGWFAGVPLWIIVWWMLIIMIWKDLALRIESTLRKIL